MRSRLFLIAPFLVAPFLATLFLVGFGSVAHAEEKPDLAAAEKEAEAAYKGLLKVEDPLNAAIAAAGDAPEDEKVAATLC